MSKTRLYVENKRDYLKNIGLDQKREYLPTCPRCGLNTLHCTDDATTFGALSRRADVYICDSCGRAEALEDYHNKEKLPLSEWSIFYVF